MKAIPKVLPRRQVMLVQSWLAWASAHALFERLVIGSIENMIMNTRKHGVGKSK
jgi:hypothetical protein